MQFFKLFWLTLASIWRIVVGGEDKTQVQHEITMQMIEDKGFSDTLVKREFLSFCQLERSGQRLDQLFDKIKEKRPLLLLDLEATLK